MIKVLRIAVVLILLLTGFTNSASAQKSTDGPLEISLILGNQSIRKGEIAEAIIIINNNSSFETTVNISSMKNKYFLVNNLPQAQFTVPPYESYQSTFQVIGNQIGAAELTVLVQYSWADPSVKQEYIKTEVLKSNSIDVTGFKVDWPNYMFPLVIGFLFGQLGTWLIDWRKQAKEDQARQEQTTGITLATLHIAQKALERSETISFAPWEDMVLKGNLYLYLIRLGKKLKDQRLANRLTDLSVVISEYNNCRAEGSLSEDFVIDLTEEINQLTKIIEQAH